MRQDALDSQLMLQAYAQGIFPMAETSMDPELFWMDPEYRGVFPIDKFRISGSMSRFMLKNKLSATLNHSFEVVLAVCADRKETWINPTLQAFYNQLHVANRCHSLEVWQGHNLIGGVFGLTIGGAFFGESMFSKRDNGSKAALAFLTTHLQKCGFTLFDTQFITDHLASLGAVEITRATYRRQLAQAIELPVSIISQPLPSLQDVLQRRTQTS